MPSPADYLARKISAPSELRSAEWDLVAAQLKERAFFMAGVQRANILQLFRNMAAQVAAGAMTPAEARVAIRAGLADLGYSPEAEGADPGSIHDLSSYRRIMLVLETNVRMAAGWMQHCQRLADPNVGAQELFRLYARRVPRNWTLRWAAAAQKVNWQGVAKGAPFIATLDSPIWPALSRFGNPYPPFDFNSGMSTRPVLIDRCRELGLQPSKPASPPALNEHMQASLASLDADLADALARSLGALAQRQGDALVMTDLNGSKKYPLQTLCRLFAAALPPGVPGLQAKAASAWALDPDSLLPGGKNAALLPALVAFASRIYPRPPAKLEQFLDKLNNSAPLPVSGGYLPQESHAVYQNYLRHRGGAKAAIVQNLPEAGKEVAIGPIKAVLSRSSIGEMLGNKALRTSLANGVTVGAHMEAVQHVEEILRRAQPGNPIAPTKYQRTLDHILPFWSEFTDSRGIRYKVYLSVQVFKDPKTPRKIYFLTLSKK